MGAVGGVWEERWFITMETSGVSARGLGGEMVYHHGDQWCGVGGMLLLGCGECSRAEAPREQEVTGRLL